MMTETVPRYHLRLLKPFSWYDTGKSQLWREWKLGSVVASAADIALLESIEGAPIERVDLPLQNTGTS
jgi:hypothetical protein